MNMKISPTDIKHKAPRFNIPRVVNIAVRFFFSGSTFSGLWISSSASTSLGNRIKPGWGMNCVWKFAVAVEPSNFCGWGEMRCVLEFPLGSANTPRSLADGTNSGWVELASLWADAIVQSEDRENRVLGWACGNEFKGDVDLLLASGEDIPGLGSPVSGLGEVVRDGAAVDTAEESSEPWWGTCGGSIGVVLSSSFWVVAGSRYWAVTGITQAQQKSCISKECVLAIVAKKITVESDLGQ